MYYLNKTNIVRKTFGGGKMRKLFEPRDFVKDTFLVQCFKKVDISLDTNFVD